MRLACLAGLLLASLTTHAAEGMWPLDRLPEAQLAAHGLKPDVTRLMQASVRLPNGSASFVSPQGLLLTNHHVVSDCIEALSRPEEPLQQRGYVAAASGQGRPPKGLRCPGMTAEQLQGIDTLDTPQAPLPAKAAARKARLDALAGPECPRAQRCEIVRLHGGAVLQRYRYRVWSDVRLVMAPENQAANYGGDDDNFNYPRHAFDFALLRVHGPDGRPLRPRHWLRPARQAPRLGDAVLVSGHPYRTERLATLAQLEADRDHLLPAQVAALQAQRDTLRGFADRDPEAARQSVDALATLENSLKALRGELAALQQPALMVAKREREQRVRAGVADSAPWDAAAQAAQAAVRLSPLEQGRRLPDGTLLNDLVEALIQHEEDRLPLADRLDSAKPLAEAQLRERLASPLPLHADLQAVQLAGQWRASQRLLGTGDPWVLAWPAAADEAQRAEQLGAWLRTSRFQQPAERLRLLDGGPSAFVATEDPLLRLAQELAPLQRAWQREHQEQVLMPLQAAGAAVARARWRVLGADEPPDATFTLRLSFGRSAEQHSGGLRQPWFTTFGSLYARADGFEGRLPFHLAPRVAAARARIDPREPLNFIATADIVGGNSGSPVLNAAGEWIGVAFDGNLDSLAGQYHYDEASNRMVVLHQRALQLALTRIYPAAHLARELGL
jgi:hypothetical protein